MALMEFWKDRVKPHRKIIDGVIEPPLAETLAATDGDESKKD
jgi:hypothetical protein